MAKKQASPEKAATDKAEKKASPEKAGAEKAGKAEKKASPEKAGAEKAEKAEKKASPEKAEPEPKVSPRLRDRYKADIVPKLMQRFGYTNPMQVPRLQKIVLNVGLGEATANPKMIDTAVAEVSTIVGQKPIVRRAKKSIANFKLRQGMPVGVTVTLRRERMWEFLDRLVSIALPRVRDFRGVSPRGFDGAGNYTLGLREQIVFPEINFDKVEKVKGMNITMVTTAESDEQAKELLTQLGVPFRS
jgi:large subunit ribosomal protein L5